MNVPTSFYTLSDFANPKTPELTADLLFLVLELTDCNDNDFTIYFGSHGPYEDQSDTFRIYEDIFQAYYKGWNKVEDDDPDPQILITKKDDKYRLFVETYPECRIVIPLDILMDRVELREFLIYMISEDFNPYDASGDCLSEPRTHTIKH